MSGAFGKTSRILILLGIASLWQSVSGYVDVYSHRFIFKKVDPTLNPAHISLYSASALGLLAVVIWWRASKGEGKRVAGLSLASAGALIEVGSGILNEIYHRVYSGTSTVEVAHLSIHGLFVLSMFIVAVGGIVGAVSVNHPVGPTREGMLLPSMIFFSSIWLLVVGSISYLAGEFLTSDQTMIYLAAGSFAITILSLIALLTFGSAGLTVAAATLFFSVNAIVLYSLGGLQFFLPLPLLAATVTELAWRFFRRSKEVRAAILTGALVGLLSGLAMYPFTLDMFSFSNTTYSSLVAMALAGTAGGLLALTLGKKMRKESFRNHLSPRTNTGLSNVAEVSLKPLAFSKP